MDNKFKKLFENFITARDKETVAKKLLGESLIDSSECDLVEEESFRAEHQLLEYLCTTYKMKPYQADEIMYEGQSLEETLKKYDL